jgi:hypothetical protein
MFGKTFIFWDIKRAVLANCFHTGDDMFLRNVVLHGVISQKMELFVTTKLRTSSPSYQ